MPPPAVDSIVTVQGIASFADRDPEGDEFEDFVEMAQQLVVEVRGGGDLWRGV